MWTWTSFVTWLAVVLAKASSQPQLWPVLGVFSQPFSTNTSQYYIAASYIKWLEVGGAQSIAIPYDASPPLLDEMFEQINGLFLPGGDATMSPSIQYMLQRAFDSNRQGSYFPVWGTCLGFEFLINFAAGSDVMVRDYEAENMSLPLYNVQRKELYGPDDVYNIVTTRNVTLNNHQQGIHPSAFLDNANLTSIWQITSINVDAKGRAFVSTIEPVESLKFPYYGVQYHPEKNAFEYGLWPSTTIPYETIDHSDAGVTFSAHMARFFVRRARLNQRLTKHAYTKPDCFPIVHAFPIQVGIAFEQTYLIPPASYWENQTEQQVSIQQ